MKKTDLAMIILIATISVMGAFFVTRAVMGSPSQDKQMVKTIQPISPDLEEPDPAIFNKDAINPAVKVELGGDQGDGGQ